MAEARAGEFRVMRFAGVEVVANREAVAGTVVLFVFFAALGRFIFSHSVLNAIVGGVVVTLLHWLFDILHQAGHSAAARRTGHPMAGVRLGFLLVLSTALYPVNEPDLPAAVHIRRALGGPFASAVVTILLGALVWAYRSVGFGWVLEVGFLESLLVFTLGALFPLGFNDGSTLIHYLRHPSSSGS